MVKPPCKLHFMRAYSHLAGTQALMRPTFFYYSSYQIGTIGIFVLVLSYITKRVVVSKIIIIKTILTIITLCFDSNNKL